ncbi:hypothetical protein AAIA72_10945 [Hahella sp. SMD15-11]|uniref:Uncharacterized protein n=1 Tax=Thermohahella caldifontis TaxID=3142973 RepID=A0AB39UT31_9GAMM
MIRVSLLTIVTTFSTTVAFADSAPISQSGNLAEQKSQANFHDMTDRPMKHEHSDRRLAHEHKRMMFDDNSPETAGVLGPVHPRHHMDNLTASEHKRLMFGQND